MRYSQEALDEMVHDVMSEKASEINNQGQEGQIAFLLAEGVEQSHIDNLAGSEEEEPCS